MNSNQIACPHCGQVGPKASPTCVSCKRPIQTAVPPRIPASPAFPTHCPFCQGDAIQRVPGLVSSQTQTRASIGTQAMGGYSPGTGFIAMGGPVASMGRSASDLALMLAAPTAPFQRPKSAFGGYVSLVFGFLMLIAAFGSTLSTETSKADSGAALIDGVIALGLMALGGYLIYRRRADAPATDLLNQRIDADNARRLQAWERSYYCGRCDVVWDAATRQGAPASRAQQLWA